jgi:RecB family exonuclease
MSLSEDEAALGMNRVRGKLINEAVRLAHIHHTYIAPHLEPTQVQRDFAIEIAGHTVTGRIDIQEGSRTLRDTKVSGRSPAKDEADRSLQLTIYAMAAAQLDGVVPNSLHLDYLVNTAQPSVVKLQTTRGRHQFFAVEERVKAAVRAIESGVFVPANPTDWWCSPSYCPHFLGCKFV